MQIKKETPNIQEYPIKGITCNFELIDFTLTSRKPREKRVARSSKYFNREKLLSKFVYRNVASNRCSTNKQSIVFSYNLTTKLKSKDMQIILSASILLLLVTYRLSKVCVLSSNLNFAKVIDPLEIVVRNYRVLTMCDTLTLIFCSHMDKF